MKVKVLADRASFVAGGSEGWHDKDAEVEVSAEEFAALEGMGYVGFVVEPVEAPAKAKKGEAK